MNAKNTKAIEILKSKMSLHERIRLMNNIQYQGYDITKAHNVMHFLYGTFEYDNAVEKFDYWYEIYSRFTEEELQQKIDIK